MMTPSTKKIYKKYPRLHGDLRMIIHKLLRRFNKYFEPTLITAYVVDTKRGYTHFEHDSFTVPLWAYEKSKDYFIYYIAHELSHVMAWRKYKSGTHDEDYYKVFKIICPRKYQHFETYYIKKSIKYGIKPKKDKKSLFKIFNFQK